MKHLCLKVLVYALFFAGQSPSYSQEVTSVHPVSYGYVSGASLADFGSVQLDKPCNALSSRHFSVAARGFKTILAQTSKQGSGDKLAAYIGLLQADPAIWSVELKHLQPAAQHSNSLAQFKMGTILYYEWGQQSSSQDTTRLAEAQSLIYSAWQKSKMPIVGMMLQEVTPFGTPYTFGHPKISQGINEELIKQLAGREAYLAYLKSAQGNQIIQAPSVQSLSVANLRVLRGVVQNRIDQSQIQGGTAVLKGNNVIFTPSPLSDDQKREYQYMTTWKAAINKSLQARHG